eukprot:3941276-Rhodomonas_salina.1
MPRLPISQKLPPLFSAASECEMKSPDRLFSTTSTGPYSSMLSRKASASLDDVIIRTPSDRRCSCFSSDPTVATTSQPSFWA